MFSGALLLGVLGAGLGALLGAAFAALMAGAVSEATGLVADVTQVDVQDMLTAAAVGIGITVLAAIEPALAAAHISPVEALRARFDLPSLRRGRLAWIAFVFLVVAALAMLAWPPVVAASDGAGRALAVYAVLLVATLLSPFLLRPLARLLGLPIALLLRIEERLARGSVARDRSRTALTLGSLVIGLAMIVALGWAAQAARASAFAWLEDVVPGDALVSSIRPIAADEPVRDALAAVPGVSRVTPIASFDLAYRGLRVDAAAVVGADFLADGRLTVVSGDRTAALDALDAGGAAILPAGLARTLDLTVGQTLTLPVDVLAPARPHGRRHRRTLDAGHERRGNPGRLEGRHRIAGRPRRRRLRGPLRARRRRHGRAAARRDGADVRPRAEPDRGRPGRDRRCPVPRLHGLRCLGDRLP